MTTKAIFSQVDALTDQILSLDALLNTLSGWIQSPMVSLEDSEAEHISRILLLSLLEVDKLKVGQERVINDLQQQLRQQELHKVAPMVVKVA